MENAIGFVLFVIAAAGICWLIYRFAWKRDTPKMPSFKTRDERGNDGHGGRDR
jgi:hypothetical protein